MFTDNGQVTILSNHEEYLANVTSFSLEVILPLGFMAIGIAIGIVISAKLCSYFTRTTDGFRNRARSGASWGAGDRKRRKYRCFRFFF